MKEDQRSAIDFVDILFALVIGSALDVLTRSGGLSAAGRAHLALASLLTIMSWIGYHNSTNRYSAEIRFDFRPKSQADLTALGKFTVDVGLVVAYWLAVQTTEGGFSGSSHQPSWKTAVLLTLVSFIGYGTWDLLAWLKRRSGRPRGTYWNWRREVTLAFLGAVTVVAMVAALLRPRGDYAVMTLDLILSVLVVAYRVAKDIEPDWHKGPIANANSS